VVTDRPRLPQPSRLQWWLIVGTLACYAVGYPLALLAHAAAGWLFVALGGLPLMALAVVTVRRIHLASDRTVPRPDSPPRLRS
jgi:hypothetical protein